MKISKIQMVVIFSVIVLLVTMMSASILAKPSKPVPVDPVACAQVVTFATNPTTGACTAFPTPCDVPTGWELCNPEL